MKKKLVDIFPIGNEVVVARRLSMKAILCSLKVAAFVWDIPEIEDLYYVTVHKSPDPKSPANEKVVEVAAGMKSGRVLRLMITSSYDDGSRKEPLGEIDVIIEDPSTRFIEDPIKIDLNPHGLVLQEGYEEVVQRLRDEVARNNQ